MLASFAQQFISGKVVDSLGLPIANVSITLSKIGKTGAILGFTASQKGGDFRIELKNKELDSLQLTLSHLSYDKKVIILANRSAEYGFELEERLEKIPEVRIARRPISWQKDTLNYSVDAFTSAHDRVIGDIIKKLPGIEVINGQILYQGKPIQKYMVDNLDLMEGSYGLLNETLPADAILDVQIIENDQPIKILKSLVVSDRASLNLRLKRFTTTGSGNVAGGNNQWSLNLTPTTFDKRFQIVNSFMTNNTGDDVSKVFKSMYTESSMNMENNKPSFLAIRNVHSPGFDERKWLNNRIFLYSSSLLKKLRNGLEVKTNVVYFNDLKKRTGRTYSEIFTPNQSVIMSESVSNRYRSNDLSAGVIIEKNEKEIYLRNNFRFQKRWNEDKGALVFNDLSTISQGRRQEDYHLENYLDVKRFIGKHFVSITSETSYGETPQELMVEPGQFSDILNGGEAIEKMKQEIHYRNFQTNNRLSFARRKGLFTFFSSVSLLHQTSRLATDLLLESAGVTTGAGIDFINALRTSKSEAKLSLKTDFEKNKWRLSLTTPYSVHVFDVQQKGEHAIRRKVKNVISPSFSVSYSLNANNNLDIRTYHGRSFNAMDRLYNGYILSNYRSLQRYEARILENKSFNSSIYYAYKNTARARFLNLGYRFSAGKQDYTFENHVDENGMITSSISDRSSTSKAHHLSGGASTFFRRAKTIVKLTGSLQFGSADYLLNEQLIKRVNRGYRVGFDLTNNLLSFMNWQYKVNYDHFQFDFSEVQSNAIISNNHHLELYFYPFKKHSLIANTAYYITNVAGQERQLFTDFTYRWTISKWGTDLELGMNNIFNNKLFIQRANTEFQLIESYFELRPRQFLISTKFMF